MSQRRLLALSLVLAGAFGVAHADDGLTRDQVRAETLAAARAGQIPHGDLDQRTEAPAASTLTRAQVRAELAQAIAAGDVESGDLGHTLRDAEPGRYAPLPVAPGLSRDQVRQELAAAMRAGDLRTGDLDRTPLKTSAKRAAA